MKRARRRFAAEFRLGSGTHPVKIARHVRVVMIWRVGQCVPAVIARVERDDLKLAKKPGPKGDIPVDRKAVAMADDHARLARIAMPSHADDSTVFARDIDSGVGLR